MELLLYYLIIILNVLLRDVCQFLFNATACTASPICFHMSHVQVPLSARLDWFKKFYFFEIFASNWLLATSISDVPPSALRSQAHRHTVTERLRWECLRLPASARHPVICCFWQYSVFIEVVLAKQSHTIHSEVWRKVKFLLGGWG